MIAASTPAGEIRIAAIDELRGLAFLAVLASHFGLGYGLDSCFAYALALPAFGVGVDLFFLISGYVAAQSFERLMVQAGGKRKLAAAAFWLRRCIRIVLPAWAIVFAIATARHLICPLQTNDDLIAASTFVANFYWAACPDGALPCPNQLVAGHFWSLALEMQFFLVAPFLLSAPRRIALPVSLLIFIFGVIMPRPVGGWLWSIRPEGFLLGIALRQKPPALPAMSLTLALYWLAIAAVFERIAQRGLSGLGLTIVAIIFAFVLAGRLSGRRAPTSAATLLRVIGRNSYAAYLVHLPVLTAVRDLTLLQLGPGLSMAAAAMAICALSYVTDILIVRPTARWSRRVSNFLIIKKCTPTGAVLK
jgi:peptidoglycan/LPS O-acetylase OafA/YrhL